MTTDRELLDAIEAVDLLRQAAAMAAPALEVLKQEAAAKGVPTADLYRRIGVRGPIVEWCQQQAKQLKRIATGTPAPDSALWTQPRKAVDTNQPQID